MPDIAESVPPSRSDSHLSLSLPSTQTEVASEGGVGDVVDQRIPLKHTAVDGVVVVSVPG